jgi:hypothetical protein
MIDFLLLSTSGTEMPLKIKPGKLYFDNGSSNALGQGWLLYKRKPIFTTISFRLLPSKISENFAIKNI